MSFASLDFVIFFCVVLLGAWAGEKFFGARFKEWFLLLASYFFYGYWDWRFCLLLLFVTVMSYVCALHAEKKPVFVTGIVVPLAVLGFFKYFNFFLSSVADVCGTRFDALSIILPVGISFYTFQALSYVIDVQRKNISPERDFVRLALYLSFFPQLVAGPIVRAVDFLPQLKETRKVTADNIRVGVQLIVFGMLKKMVLSDHMSVFVDQVYASPEAFSWATVLLAAISYSLQIYLDFSGYSDIAIGCAKCLGYDFRKNFDLPYISEDVTEFWRRWHISLSTWLKEYLYIPLGGNRKGKKRQYINLMATMLLGGLWHGASWTFVFWGFLNGSALCLDKFLRRKKATSVPMRILRTAGTFLFITFTWIFFRADSFLLAWRVIKVIFTFRRGVVQSFFWSIVSIIAVIACTAAAVVRAHKTKEQTVQGYYPVLNLTSFRGLAIFFFMVGLLLCLAYTGDQPFVYFQF